MLREMAFHERRRHERDTAFRSGNRGSVGVRDMGCAALAPAVDFLHAA
jgi:hypothetical protein